MVIVLARAALSSGPTRGTNPATLLLGPSVISQFGSYRYASTVFVSARIGSAASGLAICEPHLRGPVNEWSARERTDGPHYPLGAH